MTETKTITAPVAYRQLSEAEIELVNKINEWRAKTEEFVERVEKFVAVRGTHGATSAREPLRAVSIASTELQTGFMWLARAVAAPEFF